MNKKIRTKANVVLVTEINSTRRGYFTRGLAFKDGYIAAKTMRLGKLIHQTNIISHTEAIKKSMVIARKKS